MGLNLRNEIAHIPWYIPKLMKLIFKQEEESDRLKVGEEKRKKILLNSVNP